MTVEFWRSPVERYADERGEMMAGSPAPGLLCTRAIGHASAAMAEFFLRHCDAVVAAAGTIEGFHDWSALESYESGCRKAVTDWSLAHHGDVVRVHIHVTKRLVQMGVSVTSIVVPSLESHQSAASFRATFDRTLRAR